MRRKLAIAVGVGWLLGAGMVAGALAATGGLYEYRIARSIAEMTPLMQTGCWQIVNVRTDSSALWQLRKSRLQPC